MIKQKPNRASAKSSPPTNLASPASPASPSLIIERVQTGVRLEKRILKVLKGLAELTDLSLGDLLEGIVLHAFEGKAPFGPETLAKIADLKRIYGLDLDARASHRLKESAAAGSKSDKGNGEG